MPVGAFPNLELWDSKGNILPFTSLPASTEKPLTPVCVLRSVGPQQIMPALIPLPTFPSLYFYFHLLNFYFAM